MSERIPPTGAIRLAFAEAHPFPLTTEVDERLAEFDRWLAQHEQQLREQVARELMDHLPKALADDALSPEGWLSDGLFEGAGVLGEEVIFVRRLGSIDLHHIASHAQEIARKGAQPAAALRPH